MKGSSGASSHLISYERGGVGVGAGVNGLRAVRHPFLHVERALEGTENEGSVDFKEERKENVASHSLLSHPSRMGQRRVQADPKDLGASFFLDSSWALVPGLALR